MKEFECIEYKSWNNFKSNFVFDLYGDTYVPGKYLFRGQSNSEWDIISSLDRFLDSQEHLNRVDFENYLITDFENRCKEISLSCSKDKRIASTLAQHYGLPTRLVDWSYSPYIAAFFAFSSIGLSKDIACRNVAIYALNTEHPIWKEESGIEIVLDSDLKNNRQLQQRAVFTYNKSFEKSIEDFLSYMCSKGKDVEGALLKLIIPSVSKKNALLDLEAMGITHVSLFSGYESCAQSSLLSAINYFFDF